MSRYVQGKTVGGLTALCDSTRAATEHGQPGEVLGVVQEQIVPVLLKAMNGELVEATKAGGPKKAPVPTVGRSVHYQAYGTPGGEFKSVPRAAVIAEVHDNMEVTLCVLNPMGLFFNRVKFSEEPKAGCWNWPPIV